MTQCIVYDETTKESETFCSLTAAKIYAIANEAKYQADENFTE